MNINVKQYVKNPSDFYQFIQNKLQSHQPRTYKYADVPYKKAAVLIPFFYKNNEIHLLFTKRTNKVETHKGQISFPGGMMDETDENDEETALRETWEEMGIKPDDITILGKSDKFLTNTNFLVTPIVGYFPHPYNYKVNADEIEKVIEVPFAQLMNPDIFEIKPWEKDGIKWKVHFYKYNGEIIWGVTGFMLSNFLSIVFGLNRIP